MTLFGESNFRFYDNFKDFLTVEIVRDFLSIELKLVCFLVFFFVFFSVFTSRVEVGEVGTRVLY